MPWKLYIDSRKRVNGARGNSDTDFIIQLPYPITVSGKAFVDVCLIPNSFCTIRTGENDKIYLDENVALTKRVATIPAGQYNVHGLCAALVVALNANKAISGQYSCIYIHSENRFALTLVNAVASDQYRIHMEESLKSNWNQWTGVASANDLQSANRQCGFLDGTTINGTNTLAATAPNAPDVQPYKQLFLRSNLGGGSAESLGVNGETDIIRRIVVGNMPMNSMIHDVHSNTLDCVTINGKPEINQLSFQLIDVDGKICDTHGLPISFSIIFENLDE